MNTYHAIVEHVLEEDSTAYLRIGERGRLIARPWPGIRRGERVVVELRPEDVILCTHHPGVVSARNVLGGKVRGVKLVPGGALVHLDVGFPLLSLVTRGAVRDLHARKGTVLFAVVKAMAIPVEPEAPPSRILPRY